MAIGNWGYSNGNIPADVMASSGGVLLKPSTAAQCDAWLAAAKVRGVALAFNEGYRDLATQEYWREWWTEKGLPNNAAVPGTSTHGYGQAVDINRDAYNSDEYQAIIETGAQFGMILNSNESWHFADAGQVTGGVTTPTDSAVAAHQNYLNDAFNEGLTVDGECGPATTAAIERYQTILGVDADGAWGPVTEAAHVAYVAAHAPAPVPAPNPSTSTRATVSSGSTGQDVTDLQTALNTQYPDYSSLTVDGSFGPATDAVVREFQTRAGLTVDGAAGPQTYAALGI